MEGYKPKRDVFNLKYIQYPGLEITARGTTIGKLQQIMKLKMTVNEANQADIDFVFGFFAKRVVTWNILHPEIDLDDDHWEATNGQSVESADEPVCPVCGLEEGQLIPTTPQGLYCLELKFILSLIFGWMATIASVSDPKELSSGSGGMNSLTQETMTRLAEMQNQ